MIVRHALLFSGAVGTAPQRHANFRSDDNVPARGIYSVSHATTRFRIMLFSSKPSVSRNAANAIIQSCSRWQGRITSNDAISDLPRTGLFDQYKHNDRIT
jgi:hypothetical protein